MNKYATNLIFYDYKIDRLVLIPYLVVHEHYIQFSMMIDEKQEIQIDCPHILIKKLFYFLIDHNNCFIGLLNEI